VVLRLKSRVGMLVVVMLVVVALGRVRPDVHGMVMMVVVKRKVSSAVTCTKVVVVM
jgi:hypothetical protein